MNKLKLLFRIFNYSKFKSCIIILQIILSVYFLSAFLVPFIKNIDTLNMISNINLENKKLFIESLHIKSAYTSTNRYEAYQKINNYIKSNNNGIKNSNGVLQIHTQKSNINTFVYDEPFCYDIRLPLYRGKWFDKTEDENVIPIIVSYSLKNQYPIGSIIDLEVEKKKIGEVLNIKAKVIGILKNNGYIFIRRFK